MKAIRVAVHGGPEVLNLEDVAAPRPTQGQVLVRVEAAGVNPVDTYIRAGTYPNSTLPYTPGFDGAGTVEDIGEGVLKFKVGDRVYVSSSISGTYAESALCDVNSVHPLPPNISFPEGAALGIPYGTAYRGLFQKACAIPGEIVLVHGASGGVGNAAVQLARAAGLTVIGTSGTADGRKLVLSIGAHHALDHGATTFAEELLRLTEGRGVNVILEMLANVNLGTDLPLLAKSGRVIVIGSRGKVEINPRDAMAREATIIGLMLFNASVPETQEIHAALYAGLQGGTLRPVIRQELPLAEAARAHAAVLEPGAFGKIILVPSR
jgi:NADPH:quinone reductase